MLLELFFKQNTFYRRTRVCYIVQLSDIEEDVFTVLSNYMKLLLRVLCGRITVHRLLPPAAPPLRFPSLSFPVVERD